MKLPLLLLIFAFVSGYSAIADDLAKPTLALEVKRHLLESDTGRTFGGDSRTKTYTLRVQITNVSSQPVADFELSGEVLVKRAIDDQEKLVKETITAVKRPAMKPNERITLDFGKINVRNIEWKKGKDFEESLDEWNVVCTRAGKEFAGHQSSENYSALSKDAPPANAEKKKKKEPLNKRDQLRRRLLN